MLFEWLALRGTPYLQLMLSLPGYAVLGAYGLLVITLFARSYQGFKRLDSRRWLLLAGLIPVTPVLALALNLSLSDPFSPLDGLWLSLLGLVPLTMAAAWLGAAPAILVGLLAGLACAMFNTGRATQAFEVALMGALMGYLLNQRYTGQFAGWLRQPLLAVILSAVVVGWPLALLGMFVTDLAPALTSLDRTLPVFLPVLVGRLIEGLIAGGIVQAATSRWPTLRPFSEKEIGVTPPWGRRLNQRMLLTAVPLAALVSASLVGLVAATSYQVATRLVIEQMARDSTNAGSSIPYFVQLGRSLIRDLAADPDLAVAGENDLQTHLTEGLRAVPFFQQLIYINASQTPMAAYPEIIDSGPPLAAEEVARLSITLSEGASAEVTYLRGEGPSHVTVAFLTPVADASGEWVGVLLGRTMLDTNTIIEPVIKVLREGFVGSGEGFIVDAQRTILLYPSHPERQGQPFDLTGARPIRSAGDGQAFRQRLADGSRQLVFIRPIAGRTDWSVVVIVSNEVAVALALEIALPTLLALVALTLLALPLMLAVTRQITAPLEELLKAVELITQGQLDRPLHVTGEDEIGRLGRSFEQMRLSLKDRLSEQERLLRVTRSVASSLELFRAMPPILSSALDVTHAAGVRIVLRRSKQDTQLQTYAAGEAAATMAPLDGEVINLVERQGTVVISQIERASPALDITPLPPHLHSLVAFPLRSDTSFYGAIWLCYDHEHTFEQAEMTFLATLAGQTAVAIANARLFSDAQEGRKQLEAVLESTADAMVVVDNQGRIVLMNPAAERFFNVRGEQARYRNAADVLGVLELANLLTNLQEPVAVLELPDRAGKTLLANTSTIVSHDGAIAGRVAVLRDVTALKELDNLKTVFLRMVSHDLRSPLTFMKGYLSLLPLAGDLNEKQNEALVKISGGIEQISEMTERLHYLSRIQFGEQAELDLVLLDVKAMIEEICQQQGPLIRDKNATVTLDIEDNLPLVYVDGVLYRQAILNLINNALKYGPEGSEIIVHAYREPNRRLTVSIKDQGTGIRKEHQPRLFEAFYRVPQAEGDPKQPRGTGLGLALVRAIAHAHNGVADVESEFGKGSLFKISIPLRDHRDIR